MIAKADTRMKKLAEKSEQLYSMLIILNGNIVNLFKVERLNHGNCTRLVQNTE